MNRPKLEVEKRTLLGRKAKKLRKEGVLPANIYGKAIASTAVQLPVKTFAAIIKESGQSGLIDVVLDGETRPVLIHHVQMHPVTKLPLHADFYQVNLKEKVKTMVPLVAVGEAKAVTEKIGLMMQPVSEIEVEALPADLPENIEVTVEHLAAIGDQIIVSDLKAPAGVTIVSEPSQVVIKIDELISEDAKEQAVMEAAAAEEAAEEKTEGEKEEGEAVKENAEEEKKEEKTQEGKEEKKGE